MSLYILIKDTFSWGRSHEDRCNRCVIQVEGNGSKYRSLYRRVGIDTSWSYPSTRSTILKVREMLV